MLPQIIACTNFEFELYDKSEGMKRRVKILPTEFHVDDSVKDTDLQHKLVLNTMDPVKVAEYNPHPKYKKIIETTRHYKANDPQNSCGEGDVVRIIEARPTSKDKRWEVAGIVEKAQ